jgi:hypothetical protein
MWENWWIKLVILFGYGSWQIASIILIKLNPCNACVIYLVKVMIEGKELLMARRDNVL